MTHAYPPRRWLAAVLGQDALLAGVALAAPFAGESTAARSFFAALGLGALAVLGWGFVTLDFPSAIEIDDARIAFRRYGRVHEYTWSELTVVRVRRFLVRDRVLVRLGPSAPLRGRYWLLDGLGQYDELVREIERRARR